MVVGELLVTVRNAEFVQSPHEPASAIEQVELILLPGGEAAVHDTLSIGFDFGTTNTVVAIARPGEPVRAAQFYDDRELSDIYREQPTSPASAASLIVSSTISGTSPKQTRRSSARGRQRGEPEPGHHPSRAAVPTLAMTNASGASCSARNCCAFAWVTVIGLARDGQWRRGKPRDLS
jgi:hypothetical protein